MNKNNKQTKEENQGTSPKEAYGAPGQEAMDVFKKKWKSWNNEQKLDTLLNMILGVAYRLDILATVVDAIPDVQGMKNESKDQIKRDKEAADALKGTPLRPSENAAKDFTEKHTKSE